MGMDQQNQKNLIGLLASVAVSDGQLENSEINFMDVVLKHHVYTKEIPDELYNHIVRAVREEIRELGWQKSCAKYAEGITEVYRHTVLQLVLDLMMIDGVFHHREMQIVALLIEVYDLDKNEVFRACKDYMDKNGISYTSETRLDASEMLS